MYTHRRATPRGNTSGPCTRTDGSLSRSCSGATEFGGGPGDEWLDLDQGRLVLLRTTFHYLGRQRASASAVKPTSRYPLNETLFQIE